MTKDIDFVLSIATRKRFCRTFWKTLAVMRREDPFITRRKVFEHLEGEYEEIFGEEMWNWETFRHSREFLSQID